MKILYAEDMKPEVRDQVFDAAAEAVQKAMIALVEKHGRSLKLGSEEEIYRKMTSATIITMCGAWVHAVDDDPWWDIYPEHAVATVLKIHCECGNCHSARKGKGNESV